MLTIEKFEQRECYLNYLMMKSINSFFFFLTLNFKYSFCNDLVM